MKNSTEDISGKEKGARDINKGLFCVNILLRKQSFTVNYAHNLDGYNARLKKSE